MSEITEILVQTQDKHLDGKPKSRAMDRYRCARFWVVQSCGGHTEEWLHPMLCLAVPLRLFVQPSQGPA